MGHKINTSYWEADLYYKHYDVIIIGAGLVGLNTAIAIHKLDSSIRIAVLDRGSVPTGASTRNAGFACFGSISELMSDLMTMSEDAVIELVRMRKEGLDSLRLHVDDDQMDFHASGGYEYFRASEEEMCRRCIDEITKFNQLVFKATGLEETYAVVDPVDVNIVSDLPLIRNQYEGQLHPGFACD